MMSSSAPIPEGAPGAGDQAAPQAPLWNIANILTMLRIVMVPLFVIAAVVYHENAPMRWVVLGIFALAMITDFVDGHLARSRNLITDFGKLMDPIADKLITGAAFIILSIWDYIPWWMTLLILLREWGITIMRFTILKHGALPANFAGKAKTMMQSIAIAFCLAPFELLMPQLKWVGIVLVAIAFVLTMWSGWLNVKDGIRLRREALASGA
ncbi:CDP-diacylglycerol--glycerol-3-phosphate 3-phosphatidyltransferase [Helcobacillus sp. ACRRO]|uniref:CDP-diacylglycerol--glycerol-3-phosphate 3-phosphatidyltransferase n=1 Tax=Helcobacillus sp. ACRRO TaxID=2918202 RepID=UPI0031B88C1B